MESPEVLFEDTVCVRIPSTGKAYHPIDSRFMIVCERGTVKAVSACPDRPAMVGARIVKGELVVDVMPGDKMPSYVTVKLSGTRRGFRGMRFPYRDREQFLANERTLNAAYPAKQLPKHGPTDEVTYDAR